MKTLSAVLLTAGLVLPCRNVFSRPVVFVQPAGQTVPAGASVSLSVGLDAVFPTVESGQVQLWLRADAGVVADSFGRVRQWQDQSEHRNNASQPTAALQPLLVFPPALGGRPALRFDGMPVSSDPSLGAASIYFGDCLSGDGQVAVPGALTSFCVYRLAAPSTLEYTLWVVGQPNQNPYGECRGDMITDGIMRFTTWGFDYDSGFVVPPGSCESGTDRLDEAFDSVEMFDTSAAGTLKFKQAVASTQTPLPGYSIGGFDPDQTMGRNFVGDIAEIIIYQGALDDTDLQAVNNYLRDKYLPGTGPDGAKFQWLFDGAKIAGATNAVLLLADVRPAMAGSYSVTVSNAAGVVSSSNAVITVTPASP